MKLTINCASTIDTFAPKSAITDNRACGVFRYEDIPVAGQPFDWQAFTATETSGVYSAINLWTIIGCYFVFIIFAYSKNAFIIFRAFKLPKNWRTFFGKRKCEKCQKTKTQKLKHILMNRKSISFSQTFTIFELKKSIKTFLNIPFSNQRYPLSHDSSIFIRRSGTASIEGKREQSHCDKAVFGLFSKQFNVLLLLIFSKSRKNWD